MVATTERFVAADHTPPAEIARVKGVVALHCVEDHWPVGATACITAAADLASAHACMGQHLTVVQHERLMKALRSEPAVADRKPPPMTLQPEPSPTTPAGGQAAIAAKLHDEGATLFRTKSFADASMKFRDAVARVPEPRYYFSLCLSLFQEGKFGEALNACDAGKRSNPPAALHQKLQAAEDLIMHEVQVQGISLGE